MELVIKTQRASGADLFDGVVLDTCILIDYLNGRPEAKQYLDDLTVAAGISPVTWMEVMAGITLHDQVAVEAWLAAMFTRLDMDAEVCTAAVEIRSQSRMKLPDAIILATAWRFGATLVSSNDKDFGKITNKGLIVMPYQI